MNSKLKWKEKECGDKSGTWIEAEVKPLKWTYIVDNTANRSQYHCYLFLESVTCEETKLTDKPFKTEEAGKRFCEKHIEKTYHNMKKFFSGKSK